MKVFASFCLYSMFIIATYAQNQSALSEADFEKNRTEIAAKSFDTDRLKAAKALSDAQYLYCSQINTILNSISFESNRLDFAKYAYVSVFDPEHYEQLMKHFSMRSNQSAFQQFLDNRPALNNRATTTEEASITENTTTTEQASVPKVIEDQRFTAAVQSISEETFESRRLKRIKQLIDANYVRCTQLVELMELLSFESSKQELVYYAYPKTFDQKNYIELSNELTHKSSKTELSDFISRQEVTDYSLDTTFVDPSVVNSNSSNNPLTTVLNKVSDEDYSQIFNTIQQQSSDAQKLSKAKLLLDRTKLSAQQVKQLVELFIFENNRVDFVKYAFYRTIDPDNYAMMKEVLQVESHVQIDQLLSQSALSTDNKISSNNANTISDDDFRALVIRINGLVLESHKLEKAKTTIDRTAMSSKQVAELVALFRLEESKLDFAKYAYSKTVDKTNYGFVRSALYKNSSRFSLDRFIKDQQ